MFKGERIYDQLRGTTDPGVYVIQSERDRSCYRIGAAGTQTGRAGSLYKRLTQHHRHATPNRHNVNWTEYYRKWDILWAMPLPGASKLTVRLAEALLFGHFAARYFFLPESEGSGFLAAPEEAAMIADEAAALEPLVASIAKQQLRQCSRPYWLKGTAAAASRFVRRDEPA